MNVLNEQVNSMCAVLRMDSNRSRKRQTTRGLWL